jgi:hypothetical protein
MFHFFAILKSVSRGETYTGTLISAALLYFFCRYKEYKTMKYGDNEIPFEQHFEFSDADQLNAFGLSRDRLEDLKTYGSVGTVMQLTS